MTHEKMKKFLSNAMATLVAVVLSQCGGKPAQNSQETIEEDSADSTEQQYIMVYGLCGEGSAMNTVQVITDTNDTLNLSVEKTREENKVFGGYGVGDRLAIFMDKQTEQPLVVINENTLMGNWLMPNPLDGSSTLGLCIKDGGIAESINQPIIIYKTWKIVDGKIEITLVREGGGDEEETNLFTLEKLDADSLIFYGPEDRFEYGRAK